MDEIEALALAAAARNRQRPRGLRQVIHDNLVGNPNDGVQSFGESLGTWLNRAGESMTLGTVGDEAAAAVTGMLPGRSYDAELERYRANEEGMSTVGRLSADLTGGVVPALVGLGAVQAATTLPRAIGTAMGLGASAGAVHGFAEGEGGAGNRGVSAGVGGLVGGGIGMALPAAGAFGRQVYRGAEGAMRNSRIGRDIAGQFGVAPETGRVVARLVGEGNPDDMITALNRSGPSGMLADASPGASGMLDATMRSPAPGAAVARQRVDDRAGQAYYGVMDALMGGQQGPRLPPVANQNLRRATARPTIHPLYERAYSTPIDYSTPQGQAVEDILARAPRTLISRAVRQAQDRMTYDGFPNQQIMARIGDDGSVMFDEMPNTMMVDYIKRAFDEVAEDSRDAITGAMSSEGAFANRVARDLRSALADAVPGYDEALRAASTDIRNRAAVQAGQRLLRPQTTVEDMVEVIADATPAELRAMREGVMGQIDHIMGNVRAVATDQNVDAREAMRLYGELSSGNAQRKMAALFADEWPEVQRSLDEAGAALGLRARVAGNSATQPRQAADQMIADEVAPGALRSLQPIATAREVGQRALGSDPASVARLSDEVKSELADILTRPGGQQALSSVVQALTANPVLPTAGNGVSAAITGGGLIALPGTTDRVRSQLLPQQAR